MFNWFNTLTANQILACRNTTLAVASIIMLIALILLFIDSPEPNTSKIHYAIGVFFGLFVVSLVIALIFDAVYLTRVI
ncbi:hypothetical protein HMPREF0548_0494 [Lactobacillus ultunensis DSM 16047]|uniref:Uncharacterized protein n=1 Tax=Lactobacillus ultunensis DSM 16047 TaxID=525365 RepID=C2ELE8_9LACO|nr:hypothetical protein HMPREF0548_0494 [Lactobacillus ultunensis DSM 16047]